MCRALGEGASVAQATAVDVRMCVSSSGSGEPGESVETSRGVAELEAEGLAKRDIALDVGGQHDGTSGHGWAISDRRPKSTLA